MQTLFSFFMALHAMLFAHFHAHTQPTKPEFEVASVRPTPPTQEHGLTLGLRVDASQVRVIALPLRDIIATAYRVKSYQVSGPDWMTTTQFDISAKMAPGAKIARVPEMLQSLLADRFGLQFHRDKKDTAVYAIIVGKPPLKLRERPAESGASTPADTLTWNLTGNHVGVSNSFGDGSSYTFVGGKFEGKKLSMTSLATELERYSPRPIVNMTRLDGLFDVSFAVTPEAYGQLLARAALNSGMVMPPQVMQGLENADFSYLLEAVEQLGLKLDSRRMPVDVLVVDQVRRTPTEN
jgi:uncharacterized protein (TIGR03435 family)